MKISEVISELKKIMDEHGDLDVKCWPHDDVEERFFDLESIEVESLEDGPKYVMVDI